LKSQLSGWSEDQSDRHELLLLGAVDEFEVLEVISAEDQVQDWNQKGSCLSRTLK
jgi:hypothetical protein